MKQLKFVQLVKNDAELLKKAESVWIPFIKEVNANDGIMQDDAEIAIGLKKRISIQGLRSDMHFEIALLDNIVIGISMLAIDLGTVYGLLDHPGYGTVMGFYIKPECRRKGYGRQMYEHIQKTLSKDGARLCPDAVTGVPFWSAMGFSESGKYDPDAKKPIYIKAL